MIRRPKARCSRPERALPPGPSAPAQLTSPADGPGPASLPTEAVCLDREPPQGPPARAGGARVRVIALLDQSPATPGHLIESERAESRAPAPAREQRVPGARAPTALDASNQTITVCSHHLPRRIERCVSVTSTGGWGSADYASMHLDEARSRDLVEVSLASRKRLSCTGCHSRARWRPRVCVGSLRCSSRRRSRSL